MRDNSTSLHISDFVFFVKKNAIFNINNTFFRVGAPVHFSKIYKYQKAGQR